MCLSKLREDGKTLTYMVLWLAGLLLLLVSSSTLSQYLYRVCRTPGGNKIVLFEPMFFAGFQNTYPEIVSTIYRYGIDPIYQVRPPTPGNPNPDPDKGLLAFIHLCQNPGEMGILYIYTHGYDGPPGSAPPSIMLEYYATDAAQETAISHYIGMGIFVGGDLCQVDSIPPAPYYYGIGLTDQGIRNHCWNLNEVMVYAEACSSASLNDSWNALVALGWSDAVRGTWGSDSLFNAMLGFQWRGRGNYCREVHAAAEKLAEVCPPPRRPTLIPTYDDAGNDYTVLAPIVRWHRPGHLDRIPVSGMTNCMVGFDCQMETNTASSIVKLTGVHTPGHPPGPGLQNVQWDIGTNYRIKFDIPDLEEYCWVDILVNPNQAMSEHNHIKLDGNTNPPANYMDGAATNDQADSNGVAPDSDFYNWTIRICGNPIIGFENTSPAPSHWHYYNDPIGWDIHGIEFFPSYDPYTWRYGETNPSTNVYPYNYSHEPLGPAFWADGKWGAFHGEAGNTSWDLVAAQMAFTPGAISVCFGYKSSDDIDLTAKGVFGWIQLETLINNLNNPGSALSYSLSPIWISSPPGHHVDTLIFEAHQNTFIVDNMMVFNVPYDAIGMLPDSYEDTLLACEQVEPGGEPKLYNFEVLDIVDSLRIICNWESMEGRVTKFRVYDPDGQLIFEKETQEPAIEVPVVFDPKPGTWKTEVKASGSGETYYMAVVAGVSYVPLFDFFIAEEDITWYPELPDSGDFMVIYAIIHLRSKSTDSTAVHGLPVWCFLGEPKDSVQIGVESQALHLVPGKTERVAFHFYSKKCKDISNCEIYIVVDPMNEWTELDKNNNVAHRKIIFK